MTSTNNYVDITPLYRTEHNSSKSDMLMLGRKSGGDLWLCLPRVIVSLTLVVSSAATSYAVVSIDPGLTFTTIALSTDAAPGLPSDIRYGSLSAAVINNRGEVAFSSSLTGTGVGTNSFAQWGGPISDLTGIVIEAQAAPGVPAGLVWGDPDSSRVVLNDSGQVLVRARIRGSGISSSNDVGLWVGSPGELMLAAREGDQIPGGEALFTGIEQQPALSRTGILAFAALQNPPPVSGVSGGGIWIGPADNLQRVVSGGQTASGTGAVFDGFDFRRPVVNDSGQFAFRADVMGTGIEHFNSQGIWYGDDSGLQLLALEGQETTIEGRDMRFQFSQTFPSPQIAGNGEAAFHAEVLVRDPGGDIGGTAIFAGKPNDLRFVAVSTDPAPDADPGIFFQNLDLEEPLINSSGDVFFAADLTGSGVTFDVNDLGLWLEKEGELVKIAQTGDPAPGLPDDVEFDAFSANRLSLNASSQVAFLGRVRGGAFNGRDGLWATDSRGDLQLIALEGELFDIGEGTLKRIARGIGVGLVAGSDGTNGGPSSFSNDGDLAFRLNFDDFSSGTFIVSLPIPEPSGILLAATALALLTIRHRGVKILKRR